MSIRRKRGESDEKSAQLFNLLDGRPLRSIASYPITLITHPCGGRRAVETAGKGWEFSFLSQFHAPIDTARRSSHSLSPWIHPLFLAHTAPVEMAEELATIVKHITVTEHKLADRCVPFGVSHLRSLSLFSLSFSDGWLTTSQQQQSAPLHSFFFPPVLSRSGSLSLSPLCA